MPSTRLSVAARTDVGIKRTTNEDSFTVADLDTGKSIDDANQMLSMDVRKRGVLLVVSDGMGGHAAGEVASALVVDSIQASLGEIENPASIQALIDQAVQRANTDVLEAAKTGAKEGMGATLTAVLVHQQEAYIAEVGDSRAYVLRRGRLRQMTKDQSFVQMLLDSGAITSDQAKNVEQKNWIMQAMGLEANVHVAIGRLHLRNGDRLLLCSDGLYTHLEEDELATLLHGKDLKEICDAMIDLANERGGTDNITVIVAAVEGEDLPFADQDESVTQTFEVLQEYAGMAIEEPSRKETPSDPPEVEFIRKESSIPTIRPPMSEQTDDESSPSSSMTWLPIVAAVLALGAIAYWLLAR